MKKSLLLIAMALFAFGGFVTSSQAQNWVKMMQDPNVNFYDVQKAFNKYYEEAKAELAKSGQRKEEADEEKNEANEVPGYGIYKRWEWYMSKRVSPAGDRYSPDEAFTEVQRYLQQNPNANVAGNWALFGPGTVVGTSIGGAGRLNYVRIHPTDPNTLFVGSPSGGLWKSTNGGTTWSTNTDFLPSVIGSSDLAIDPTNPNVMYLATGDETGAVGEKYSIGILKTTDGGNTWAQTGLIFGLANFRQISRIIINPNNTSIVIAATSGGIYRSTDAGTTFTLALGSGFKDLEFKPGDPNTVYACGTTFARSTNAGASWTTITSGLPAAATLSRMAIAVTEADPTIVYMSSGLVGPGYGQDGFYRSTTSGTSFVKMSTPSGMGTQQWYDLAIGASPTNAQEVMIGGQTGFFKSTNGGTGWTQIATSTHVDYHDAVYASATTAYLTSDGGIYKTTNGGTSWSSLNSNLAISEMYGFGQSVSNANLNIQGWQDNGTNRFNGTWSASMGGDGMLCFIGRTNDNNMWGSQYEGSLNKSTNGGTSWSGCTGNISGAGGWVTPWKEDPVTANTIYAGFNDLWKHTSGGGTTGWTKISTFGASGASTIDEFTISPADNKVIWVSAGGKLYKTNNGGTSWTTIASAPAATVSYIACSSTDKNKAWITYYGYSAKFKVYQTTDQGVTWTDLASGSLPNIPVDCIIYDKNSSNDALYIGTDAGIFYKDATVGVWQPFYNGLPNTMITQLAIFYPTGKIRASTFGRGMWESDLYTPGTYPPIANFTQDNNMSCPGSAIQFIDYSSGVPTSWSWSFPGGSPSSSTQQSPLVVYNTPGTYTVTLSATNATGTDTRIVNNLVTISASPYSAPTASGVSFCGPKTVTFNATGTGLGTIRWWNAQGGGTQVGTGPSISPMLTSTTDYYVDEDFPGGAQDLVGEAFKNIGTGAYFTANDIRGLYFDVYKPVILNTVQVYSNSAGNRTIEVLDAAGNSIAETTVFMAASPNTLLTVPVNLKLYPGTGYFIKCRGTVDLWRNDAGATFPYISSDIDITGTNASGLAGYYYFFYNWEYTEIVCNTARRLVTATDTCSTIGIYDLFTNGTLEIFPNPNKGEFNLSFFVENKDNYKINISNALGQAVFRKDLGNFAGSYSEMIDIGEYGKGLYLLSITNSKNETVKKVIVY